MADKSGRRGCARMVVSSMVSEVRRRMVPLPRDRFRVEDDEMEVVLVWVDVDEDVDDREQWMMKIASRTNIDDEEEEGDDLFGR